MANLIVNLNNYNDSKCEIIVNGVDIFKNQKRIPITKSGTYKINIIIYNTMKIKNKFHFNLKTCFHIFLIFIERRLKAEARLIITELLHGTIISTLYPLILMLLLMKI